MSENYNIVLSTSFGEMHVKKEIFFVTINVLEGRHFVWPNMDSAVQVNMGNQKKCTGIVRNTDNPYFNENFAFEFLDNFDRFVDETITFTVFQPKKIWRKRKILGYVTLDVGTVWAQTDHQFYHKWAILSSPKNDTYAGPRGYLKVDINVFGKGNAPKEPSDFKEENDEIEGNLLLPEGLTVERQKANYIFKIYRGEDLYKIKNQNKMGEPLSACIEIRFAGLKGVTSVKKSTPNPVWNESIVLSELFPPLCQRVKIFLGHVDAIHHKIMGVRYVNLFSISNDGEYGFLPTFGPTFVHFYSYTNCGEVYAGNVLMSMQTELRDNFNTHKRAVFLENVEPLNELSTFRNDTVLVFVAIFGITRIDRRFDKSISFELHFGSSLPKTSNYGDGDKRLNVTPQMDATKGKYYGHLDYKNTKPCISTVANLPDCRKRLFDANLIENTAGDLKTKLDYIENLFVNEEYGSADQEIEHKLIELFDTLSSNCTKCIDIISSKNITFGTNLDKERTRLCLKELEDMRVLCKTAYNSRAKKKSFAKAQKIYKRLQVLAENPQGCWPDIYVWMLNSGKRIGVFKIPARNVSFSIVPEETGVNCAKLQTVVFKPCTKKKNDPNIACLGKVFIWAGLKRHQDECFQKLPRGFGPTGESPPLQVRGEQTNFFQCRAHIFQGRFNPGHDESGLCDPFVRITIDVHTKQTLAAKKTLQPVWDQTVIFKKVILYENKHSIKNNPPAVLIEIFDKDECCKTEYLGSVIVAPVVKLDDETYTPPNFPPKLKWRSVYRDYDDMGSVLIAVELLQLSPSADLDKIVDTDEVLPIPKDIKPNLVEYKMEVFFWGVRDLKKVCFLAVIKPKMVIECASHTISSDTITNAKKHPNFDQTIKTAIVNIPEQEEYAPPLSIKMFDSRSFGRLTYVGTHVVPLQRLFYHPQMKAKRKFETSQLEQKQLENPPQNRQENSSGEKTCVCNIPKRNNTLQITPVEKTQMVVLNKFKSVAEKILGVKKEERERNFWEKFRCKFPRVFWYKKPKNTETPKEQQHLKRYEMTEEEDNEDSDWWTKYYASYQDETSSNGDENFRLKIFSSELESQPQFRGFCDILNNFQLYRGKQTGDETIDEANVMGIFKGDVRIYRSVNNVDEYINNNGTSLKNGAFDGYPINDQLKYLVRVYCVKATGLIPKDINGKSDPYICITLNETTIEDRNNYVPNQTNPIFGRCYELNGVFPNDYLLKVAVWDYDLTSSDDLVGETKIDLENRVYTNHRATCGLSSRYNDFGYNKWRDQQRPSQILENLCNQHRLPKPLFRDNSVTVGSKVFHHQKSTGNHNETDNDDATTKESLALLALRRWHEVPYVGTHLVPEHVEMRSLYNPAKPGIEQGKLHLWVDIFPCSDNPPPKPIDISPRKALKYELRAIIWNTEDVLLEEDDFFAGEKRSDIYVKGWLVSPEEAQYTDVHYRSLTGEGNFNWRFVFKFEYISAENRVVLYRKEKFFSVEETEFKIPCKLTLQVWDNDIVSKDDFLGSVSLELARLPRGAKSAQTCKLDNIEMGVPTVNLFKIKRTKGWWPFAGVDKETKKQILAGKVEIEFELLTAEEAEKSPAGFAREDPQGLPKPNRPDTSFSWFRNPFKALKYLICKQYRWKIIRCTICLLLILMVFCWFYLLPQYSLKKFLHLY